LVLTVFPNQLITNQLEEGLTPEDLAAIKKGEEQIAGER